MDYERLKAQKEFNNRLMPAMRKGLPDNMFEVFCKRPRGYHNMRDYNIHQHLRIDKEVADKLTEVRGIDQVWEAIYEMSNAVRQKRRDDRKYEPAPEKGIHFWNLPEANGKPKSMLRKRSEITNKIEEHLKRWKKFRACEVKAGGLSHNPWKEPDKDRGGRAMRHRIELSVDLAPATKALSLMEACVFHPTPFFVVGVYDKMKLEHANIQDVDAFQVSYLELNEPVKWGWLAKKEYSGETFFGLGDDAIEAVKRVSRQVTKKMTSDIKAA